MRKDAIRVRTPLLGYKEVIINSNIFTSQINIKDNNFSFDISLIVIKNSYVLLQL